MNQWNVFFINKYRVIHFIFSDYFPFLIVLNKRKKKNMENCLSKELEDDNAIETIKKVYQVLLLAKERLADVVYSSEDQWGEDK